MNGNKKGRAIEIALRSLHIQTIKDSNKFSQGVIGAILGDSYNPSLKEIAASSAPLHAVKGRRDWEWKPYL